MNKKWTTLLGLLMVAVFANTAMAADSTPTAWGPVSSFFGPSGLTLPPGLFAVGGNVLFGKSDGVWKGSRRRNGTIKSTKLNEVFKMRYGIMDGLDVRSATPFYSVHLDKTETSDHNSYGVGDTTVVFHKRLLSQALGDPLSVAMDMGVVLPTGSVSSHSLDDVGYDSWGGMIGLGATYFMGANRFDSEVNFSDYTEGAHSYQKGSIVRWNLSYAYALSDRWDIGAESLWTLANQARISGDGQNNSYVEWYVGPKVVYKYAPWGLDAGLAVTAPVHRWYESTKAGSDDFRVEFKILKTFQLGALF